MRKGSPKGSTTPPRLSRRGLSRDKDTVSSFKEESEFHRTIEPMGLRRSPALNPNSNNNSTSNSPYHPSSDPHAASTGLRSVSEATAEDERAAGLYNPGVRSSFHPTPIYLKVPKDNRGTGEGSGETVAATLFDEMGGSSGKKNKVNNKFVEEAIRAREIEDEERDKSQPLKQQQMPRTQGKSPSPQPPAIPNVDNHSNHDENNNNNNSGKTPSSSSSAPVMMEESGRNSEALLSIPPANISPENLPVSHSSPNTMTVAADNNDHKVPRDKNLDKDGSGESGSSLPSVSATRSKAGSDKENKHPISNANSLEDTNSARSSPSHEDELQKPKDEEEEKGGNNKNVVISYPLESSESHRSSASQQRSSNASSEHRQQIVEAAHHTLENLDKLNTELDEKLLHSSHHSSSSNRPSQHSNRSSAHNSEVHNSKNNASDNAHSNSSNTMDHNSHEGLNESEIVDAPFGHDVEPEEDPQGIPHENSNSHHTNLSSVLPDVEESSEERNEIQNNNNNNNDHVPTSVATTTNIPEETQTPSNKDIMDYLFPNEAPNVSQKPEEEEERNNEVNNSDDLQVSAETTNRLPENTVNISNATENEKDYFSNNNNNNNNTTLFSFPDDSSALADHTQPFGEEERRGRKLEEEDSLHHSQNPVTNSFHTVTNDNASTFPDTSVLPSNVDTSQVGFVSAISGMREDESTAPPLHSMMLSSDLDSNGREGNTNYSHPNARHEKNENAAENSHSNNDDKDSGEKLPADGSSPDPEPQEEGDSSDFIARNFDDNSKSAHSFGEEEEIEEEWESSLTNSSNQNLPGAPLNPQSGNGSSSNSSSHRFGIKIRSGTGNAPVAAFARSEAVYRGTPSSKLNNNNKESKSQQGSSSTSTDASTKLNNNDNKVEPQKQSDYPGAAVSQAMYTDNIEGKSSSSKSKSKSSSRSQLNPESFEDVESIRSFQMGANSTPSPAQPEASQSRDNSYVNDKHNDTINNMNEKTEKPAFAEHPISNETETDEAALLTPTHVSNQNTNGRHVIPEDDVQSVHCDVRLKDEEVNVEEDAAIEKEERNDSEENPQDEEESFVVEYENLEDDPCEAENQKSPREGSQPRVIPEVIIPSDLPEDAASEHDREKEDIEQKAGETRHHSSSSSSSSPSEFQQVTPSREKPEAEIKEGNQINPRRASVVVPPSDENESSTSVFNVVTQIPGAEEVTAEGVTQRARTPTKISKNVLEEESTDSPHLLISKPPTETQNLTQMQEPDAQPLIASDASSSIEIHSETEEASQADDQEHQNINKETGKEEMNQAPYHPVEESGDAFNGIAGASDDNNTFQISAISNITPTNVLMKDNSSLSELKSESRKPTERRPPPPPLIPNSSGSDSDKSEENLHNKDMTSDNSSKQSSHLNLSDKAFNEEENDKEQVDACTPTNLVESKPRFSPGTQALLEKFYERQHAQVVKELLEVETEARRVLLEKFVTERRQLSLDEAVERGMIPQRRLPLPAPTPDEKYRPSRNNRSANSKRYHDDHDLGNDHEDNDELSQGVHDRSSRSRTSKYRSHTSDHSNLSATSSRSSTSHRRHSSRKQDRLSSSGSELRHYNNLVHPNEAADFVVGNIYATSTGIAAAVSALGAEEVLNRKYLEELEQEDFILTRRLLKCVKDAFDVSLIAKQEQLGRDILMAEMRKDKQQRLELDEIDGVHKEILYLRNLVTEAAEWVEVEKVKRNGIVNKERDQFKDMTRQFNVGLAALMRQQNALYYQLTVEQREALEDEVYREKYMREEIRIEEVRQRARLYEQLPLSLRSMSNKEKGNTNNAHDSTSSLLLGEDGLPVTSVYSDSRGNQQLRSVSGPNFFEWAPTSNDTTANSFNKHGKNTSSSSASGPKSRTKGSSPSVQLPSGTLLTSSGNQSGEVESRSKKTTASRGGGKLSGSEDEEQRSPTRLVDNTAVLLHALQQTEERLKVEYSNKKSNLSGATATTSERPNSRLKHRSGSANRKRPKADADQLPEPSSQQGQSKGLEASPKKVKRPFQSHAHKHHSVTPPFTRHTVPCSLQAAHTYRHLCQKYLSSPDGSPTNIRGDTHSPPRSGSRRMRHSPHRPYEDRELFAEAPTGKDTDTSYGWVGANLDEMYSDDDNEEEEMEEEEEEDREENWSTQVHASPGLKSETNANFENHAPHDPKPFNGAENMVDEEDEEEENAVDELAGETTGESLHPYDIEVKEDYCDNFNEDDDNDDCVNSPHRYEQGRKTKSAPKSQEYTAREVFPVQGEDLAGNPVYDVPPPYVVENDRRSHTNRTSPTRRKVSPNGFSLSPPMVEIITNSPGNDVSVSPLSEDRSYHNIENLHKMDSQSRKSGSKSKSNRNVMEHLYENEEEEERDNERYFDDDFYEMNHQKNDRSNHNTYYNSNNNHAKTVELANSLLYKKRYESPTAASLAHQQPPVRKMRSQDNSFTANETEDVNGTRRARSIHRSQFKSHRYGRDEGGVLLTRMPSEKGPGVWSASACSRNPFGFDSAGQRALQAIQRKQRGAEEEEYRAVMTTLGPRHQSASRTYSPLVDRELMENQQMEEDLVRGRVARLPPSMQHLGYLPQQRELPLVPPEHNVIEERSREVAKYKKSYSKLYHADASVKRGGKKNNEREPLCDKRRYYYHDVAVAPPPPPEPSRIYSRNSKSRSRSAGRSVRFSEDHDGSGKQGHSRHPPSNFQNENELYPPSPSRLYSTSQHFDPNSTIIHNNIHYNNNTVNDFSRISDSENDFNPQYADSFDGSGRDFINSYWKQRKERTVKKAKSTQSSSVS